MSSFGVDKYDKLRHGNEKGMASATMDDRYKLQLFRDQRNWWISLSNFILWLVCWRLASLVQRKEQAMEELQAEAGGAKPAVKVDEKEAKAVPKGDKKND